MEKFINRKTIRKYSNRDISDKLLNQLLSDASHTPTMGNLQLYSVIVTRDEQQKKKLSPAHYNQPMVIEAPVVLTICADFRRTTLWCQQRKANPGYNNFLSFVNAATDALLYCQTLTNIAEYQGLGTCFLGTTIYNPDLIIDALKLPKLVMPIATLTLGYPDEEPALSDRLSTNAFVHQETYQDYTAEKIDDIYRPKEQLDINKQFVEINKKETLAQVFTDLRYRKSDNELLSTKFIETLKKQDFLNL